jgi:hypothetical protein
MNLKLYFIYAILIIGIEKFNIRSAQLTRHEVPLEGELEKSNYFFNGAFFIIREKIKYFL